MKVFKEKDLESLDEKKEVLKNYLLAKVEFEDWHAVSDVAMDLRELEIKIRYLKNSL